MLRCNIVIINTLYKSKLKIEDIKGILKERKNEDVELIEQIEKQFIKKRGYVFKMPKKKTPCIILASSGLDSIISTYVLLEFYKLKLFPLFINWGQKNLKQELKSFRFFYKYFKKRYPDLYQKYKIINSNIPAKEIFTCVDDVVVLRNTSFINHAVAYSNYINKLNKIKIRNIFLNTVATDGVLCADTTLTAIRTSNLNVCVNESDYSWQISSVAIEKELGFFFNKEDLIPIAVKGGIPLEKTWSCYQLTKVQCGECFTCWGRINGFMKAGIIDKTLYLKNDKFYIFKKKVIKHIKKKLVSTNNLLHLVKSKT